MPHVRFASPALLLALVLATPLAAQGVPGNAATLRARPPGNGSTVIVWPRTLQSLQTRLDGFAAGLPTEERALWDGLLLRAATAPGQSGEVRVLPVLQIGPGGGCDGTPGMDEAASRVAIIVEGGRTASPATGIVVQGGRTAQPVRTGTPGARPGVGARPGAEAPRPNPGSAVSIGPKQEDPARPVPQILGRRLAEFSSQLSGEERGALEWLLTRAAAAPEARPGPGGLPAGAAVAAAPEGRPGPGGLPAGAVIAEAPQGRPGPGGLPVGTTVSLRQALGIDPISIGPKQEDPAPPPPAQQWILRY